MVSTKERILIAATDLLDAGGPPAVTLRAVGDAAGVSQSAPYRHYVDKRALLDAMVRRIVEQLGASVKSARSESASSIAALNLVVSQYFEFARRFPVRYRLLLEESRGQSEVAAEARQAFAAIGDLVHAAQRSGDLRDGDPEQIVALIFGAVHGMADLEQFGLIKVESDAASSLDLPSLLVQILARGDQPVPA
jgi:AcrR family transcriptional regulator